MFLQKRRRKYLSGGKILVFADIDGYGVVYSVPIGVKSHLSATAFKIHLQ